MTLLLLTFVFAKNVRKWELSMSMLDFLVVAKDGTLKMLCILNKIGIFLRIITMEKSMSTYFRELLTLVNAMLVLLRRLY